MSQVFKKKLTIAVVASILLMVVFLLFQNSYKYLDPDLGWHLKVGEDIIKEFDAPRVNNYNFTLLGKPWIDHEWLMEVLMFSVFEYFSYFSLHLLFVVVAILAFFFAVLPIFKKYGWIKGFFISLPFLLFGIYSSLPHFGLRPQEFALMFTALLLFVIYNFETRGNFNSLIFLLPLFLIWANLHGSFLLGLGLLLAWYLMKIILSKKLFLNLCKKLNCSFGRLLSKKEKIIFPLLIFSSFLVTLINPYGLDLYASLGEYSNTFYLSNIAEWLPQFTFPFNYPQILFLAISLTMVFLFIIEPLKDRGKINIWQLFLFLFLFILAFKSKRHFPLLVIVSLPLLAEITFYYFKQIKNIKFYKIVFIINSALIIVLSILLAVLFYLNTNWHKDPFQHFCGFYPCQAVEFLQKNPDLNNLNVYNLYGWGGYLIWTNPDRLLFIDGRMPHYPYEGRSILQEYADFDRSDKELVEDKILKHDISLFLLKKTKEHNKSFKWWEKLFLGLRDEKISTNNNLQNYLNESLLWENIYEDKTAIIFKKNKP
jgi:hypothetical protein